MSKAILWKNLKAYYANHKHLPHLVLGGFNEISCSFEKFGGLAPSVKRMHKFKDNIEDCNLLNLGFFGPRFTWSNLRRHKNLIMERLDRFLANPEWIHLFQILLSLTSRDYFQITVL